MEELGFSVGVISLSWFFPIIASGIPVSPLYDLAVHRLFQGSWRGHACIGLGRNKWHFPSFNGTHTPSGYVPLRTLTALLTASKQSQDGTAVPSWLCLEAVFKNRHETYQCRMYSRKLHDDGQRRCPKHAGFYNRINLDNWCVWLVFKKKSVTMHVNMNVKFTPWHYWSAVSFRFWEMI